MITRISTEGSAGGSVKTETDRIDFNLENGLDFLILDISLGFKPIEIKKNRIILEKYNSRCTWVEHQYYEGSSKKMEKLVVLATTHKNVGTVPA